MSNPSNKDNYGIIVTKIEYIQETVAEIKHKLESNYVTQDQFEPVKRVVYGMVSVVLLAVIGAITALALK